MKIFIPRNISWGRFNMSVQVGPASISVFQLIILAIWLGLWLSIWNNLYNNGVGRWAAMIVAIPIFLVFVFIAFFKYSELTLLPFIAKMIRTYFLDVTKKFHINYIKPDPKAIVIAKSRKWEHNVVISQKDLILDKEKMVKLHPFFEEVTDEELQQE